LPETKAIVSGVHSGVTLDSVSFFANILIPLDLPPYAFKVWKIEHVHPNRRKSARSPKAPSTGRGGFLSGLFGGDRLKEEQSDDVEMTGNKITPKSRSVPLAEAPSNKEEEFGPPRRQETLREKVVNGANAVANTIVTGSPNKRPAVPAKLFSPLHLLTLLSCVVSLVILATAIYWHDGTAILAVFLISVASSIVGLASLWEPQLMSTQSAENQKLPPGDIMIRTREGAFIYVKCDESVARELFSGTEECKYTVGSKLHDALMAVGTIILMLAVVLLGNCKWNSQIFIGASYIVLNGLYWAIGMLPKRYSWDLTRYDVEDITPPDARHAEKQVDLRDLKPTHGKTFARIGTKFTGIKSTATSFVHSGSLHRRRDEEKEEDPAEKLAAQADGDPGPTSPEARACFTRTLWYAIRETETADWARRSNAAPRTDIWEKWLDEADLQARKKNRIWAAVAFKDDVMKLSQPSQSEKRP